MIDANISEQLPKFYLFDSLKGRCVGRHEPLRSLWGKAPAAKCFPGYYKEIHGRWMRESHGYFSVICPKSGGTVPPTPKVGPPVGYAHGHYMVL